MSYTVVIIGGYGGMGKILEIFNKNLTIKIFAEIRRNNFII